MKNKLTHNLGLKIMAVLFSAVLWLISININDPVEKKIYTVPVEMLNEDAMTTAGKYVEVLDNTDTVSVTVRASRSVLDAFSESNLMATADLNEVTEDNEVPIEVTATKSSDKLESIKLNRDYVSISLEEIKRIQMIIEATTKNEPAEGYILGKISADQNAMRIWGPESIVSQVVRANVEVDIANATSDISIRSGIKLYDANDKEVATDKLKVSVSEVLATATILETKWVSMNFSTTGEPAEGYAVTGIIESQPKSVLIAGKSSVIKNINSIDIPEAINVTSSNSDMTALIDLKQYLPDNVIFGDSSFSGKVSATAKIEKLIQKTLEIESKNIALTNLPNGFEGKITGLEDLITLNLVGLQTAMDQVTQGIVTGTVDVNAILEQEALTELVAGSYQTNVVFTLPEGVEVTEPVTVTVVIGTLAE